MAGRIGLLNTMVFTHLPSNVLLMLIPAMPSLEFAAACLLLRMSLSQMDVPTRQSYIVAVVDPEERTAAASLTNVARNVAQATTPALAGYAMEVLSLGLPFLLGGGLKIVYDLLLLAAFQTLLHRYSGQTENCIGTPIANRTRAEVEGLIGLFINTLVIRTSFSGDRLSILLPMNSIVPLAGRMSPDMVFKVVVFPAPLEPRRVTISAVLTSREIPRRA